MKIKDCLVLLSGVLLFSCQALYAEKASPLLGKRISRVFSEEMAKSKAIGGILLVMRDGDTEKPKIISSNAYGAYSDQIGRFSISIRPPF